MGSFVNSMAISSIRIFPTVHCYCPLGSSHYTGNLEITFKPNRVIPDYCEIDNAVKGLEGQSLVAEDLVARVYDIAMAYEPKHLVVTVKVADANHSTVIVTKELGFDPVAVVQVPVP